MQSAAVRGKPCAGGSLLLGLLQGHLYCVLATFSCLCVPLLSAFFAVAECFCFPTGIMTSRQTNTSQEAALFGIPSSVAASISTPPGNSSTSTSYALAPSVSTSSGLSSGLTAPFSPELAAFISHAVQAAFQSHFAASSAHSVPASAAVSAPPASSTASAGVPAPLSSMASSFLDSGAGFQSNVAAIKVGHFL